MTHSDRGIGAYAEAVRRCSVMLTRGSSARLNTEPRSCLRY